MAKVEAPNKDYRGTGPGGAVFEDGVAEVTDEAALNYYRGAGYAVSGKVETPADESEPVDPRDLTHVTVGTALRDAAVDPKPGDFLAPVNAGEGNPHGPAVVSPEIHASGPSGIRPGEVFAEDAAKQEKREQEFARARLVENATMATAVKAEVPDLKDHGEIGLSDPGSADQGRAAADDGSAPSKANNKAAWVDYAVEQGAERDEAEAMTKADLVERYS